MADILQQLFEGELKLGFRDIEEMPEYQAARRAIREAETPFYAKLTREQQVAYEALMQQSLSTEYILTVEAFRRGFSTAVQLLAASIARRPEGPRRE